MASKSSSRQLRSVTRSIALSILTAILTMSMLAIDFVLPCGLGTSGLEQAAHHAITTNLRKSTVNNQFNSSLLSPRAPWPPAISPRRIATEHPPRFTWVMASLIYNEAQYLLEWIAWHRLMGCDHFYLYDHRSTDGPSRVLAPLIERGIVTLIRIPSDAGGVPADGSEAVGKGKPTSFLRASQLFRQDFPSRIRSATWASNWDVDEFLVLGNSYPSFPHFLAAAAARGKGAVGGIKLSRRAASTSGRKVRLAPHELAVTTFLDIETELAASRNDPGKITVRVELSNPGFLVAHKLFGSRGALVNVRCIPAKKRTEKGDSAGLDVPFAPEAPFLIHHITRSYEECKWKDEWESDRQGTWRHKMPTSICDIRNQTSPYYMKSDYSPRPNDITKMILARRNMVCHEMRNLNREYCQKVACCGEI